MCGSASVTAMEHISCQISVLDGIRIVDLTTVVFGPYATQTLGDYGADIIKVEAPSGDGTRYNGPGPEQGMSALFMGSNRNKRSIVIDLRTPEGREALLVLCDTADVFVHNIRPQKLERIGLDSAVLRARNPRLIYVALLGFGSGGPYAGLPAYDDIIQSLSGAADLVRRQTGVSGYMPTLIADKVAAQMAVHAVLAALFQRERSGKGQYVEVPMFEAVSSFLLVEHYFGQHWPEGAVPEAGYPRLFAPWRRPYPTIDGYVCVMPYTQRNWQDFLTEVGQGDLLLDARFATHATRMNHVAELLGVVAQVVATEATAHWLDLCARLDIPCAAVHRLEDLEGDPHLQAVDFFRSAPVGAAGSFHYPRFPIHLDDNLVSTRVPPRLGEHTNEILSGLTLSDHVRLAVLASRDGKENVPDPV